MSDMAWAVVCCVFGLYCFCCGSTVSRSVHILKEPTKPRPEKPPHGMDPPDLPREFSLEAPEAIQ